MRLLFVLEDLRIGGAQRHALELVRALAKDHEVKLIAISDLDARLAPEAGETVVALGRRGFDPWTWAHLGRRIVRFAPDLVVSINQVATLAVSAARLVCGLSTPHAVIFHSSKVDSLAGRLRTAPFIPAVRSADALIYVSANQRRAWTPYRLRARRTETILNGIDLAHFPFVSETRRRQAKAALDYPADSYLIGMSAVFRPEKNISQLLQALHRLRLDGLAAEVLLIGDGPERGRIEADRDRLGLSDHVRITGLQADVRPFLAAVDVGALTSSSIETSSLAAMEIMATGAPMIMSDIGGASEIVEDGVSGLLCATNDVVELTYRLSCLADRATRRSFGEAAVRRARAAFGLQPMVDAYARLFSSLASKAPGRCC